MDGNKAENDVMASGVMKPRPAAKKKEFKPVLVRIGMWTCLVAIASSSVYTVAKPIIYPAGAQQVKKEAQQPQFHMDTTLGVDEFARNFAYFWLLNDKEALEAFTAQGFKLADENFQDQKKREVKNVLAWGAEQKGKNRVNILVKARVRVDGEDHNVFLSVPVAMEPGGKYGVYGIPTFVPDPGRAQAPNENVSGSLVSAETERKIKSIIDSFFRFYTQGQSKDLALLFDDGKPRTTLVANYAGINELELYQIDDEQVLAKTTVWLELEGIKALQSYQFVFLKKGDEWKISSTDPVIPVETEKEE
jgi:hypothetical protein